MSQLKTPNANGNRPRQQELSLSTAKESEAELGSYLEILFRRRAVILFVFVVVFLIGAGFTLTRKKVYEAVTTLVVLSSEKGGAADSNSILSNLSALTQGRNVGTQVAILNSPDLLREALENIPADKRELGFKIKGKATKAPEWIYKIVPLQETDAISITSSAFDPYVAADFANSIAQAYLDRDLRRSNQANKQGREYVQKELDRTKVNLRASMEKLAAYKRKTGLIAPSEHVVQATDEFFTLRQQRDQLVAEGHAADNELVSIKAQLSKVKPFQDFSTTLSANPRFGQIQLEIAGLEADHNRLAQLFSSTSPEIQRVNRALADAERRLRTTTQEIVSARTSEHSALYDSLLQTYANTLSNKVASEAKLKAANESLATAQAALAVIPDREKLLAEYEDEVRVLRLTFDQLSTRYYELHINEQSSLPNGFIASYAHPDATPVSPNVGRNMTLFFVLALVAGLLAAIGLDRIDTRIHDPAEIERLASIPMLAAVPEADHNGIRPIIGETGQNSSFLESFRILRNNIVFSGADTTLKVIGVTSSDRSEGKSTTSINLAISMAMDGKRVLLVDCDLRRPAIHTWLNQGRDLGLTNVVLGRATLEGSMIESPHENLYCLLSGPLPPNPTEFLNSSRCREVFEDLRNKFDVVVVDSPPCIGLSDMQVISTFVDGVVLVTTFNVTQKTFLRVTLATLRQANANIVGYVFNRLSGSGSAYGGYRYAYYYRYYSYSDYYGEGSERSKSKSKGIFGSNRKKARR